MLTMLILDVYAYVYVGMSGQCKEIWAGQTWINVLLEWLR